MLNWPNKKIKTHNRKRFLRGYYLQKYPKALSAAGELVVNQCFAHTGRYGSFKVV